MNSALWFSRTRWLAMAAGLAIHLGIEATLLIGWFSLTILSCYLAFVPADVLHRLRARWLPPPRRLPEVAVPPQVVRQPDGREVEPR